jgi:hypothetical protein
MSRPRLGILSILVAVTVALTSCTAGTAPGKDDPMTGTALTLEAAKEQTIALGEEIASFVDPAVVTATRTVESSKSLLPCSGMEDGYGWPGRTTLEVQDVADETAALEPIAAEWESREGWKVERRTTSNGHASLDLEHLDGSSARVSFMRDGAELWISVVSPCFTLPGGFVYGTDY